MTDRRRDDYLQYLALEARRTPRGPLEDWQVRANLRADIDAAIHRHTMTRSEAHAAVGLVDGALGDNSLDLDDLRQVLATLRARPGGMADLSFAMGWAA